MEKGAAGSKADKRVFKHVVAGHPLDGLFGVRVKVARVAFVLDLQGAAMVSTGEEPMHAASMHNPHTPWARRARGSFAPTTRSS